MKIKWRAAAAALLCGCLLNVSVSAVTFTDVPGTFWGHTFIERANKEGLVSGMGDGTFGVNKTLSTAEFITMVCNLFYKDEVNTYAAAHSGNEWWYSYITVAYEKGLLDNTTAGLARESGRDWSLSSVGAQVSRYDMAQIMANILKLQSWAAPTSGQLAAAQTKIADWSQIPAQYQTAVATSYARDFLSGMDAQGTFRGADSMTRTHGAVVMCKLLDARQEARNNTISGAYANTTKLVNGKEPTAANVKAALTDLKKEYSGYVWNTAQSYLSPVLGSAAGSDAFIYMINDRVFGNLSSEQVKKAEDLKPGDVIFLRSQNRHIVVTDREGDTYTYLSCNSMGRVAWDSEGKVDDLTSQDTIHTRYQDTRYDPNSGIITQDNVADSLAQFKRREYKEGSTWDMDESYRSTPFSSGSVTGSEAFAYYLSDYIFDDAKVTALKDVYDVRVGDVLYLRSDRAYGVVTEIKKDVITYVSVSSRGRVAWDYTVDLDDLNSRDAIYTRYSKAASSTSSSSRESNVADGLAEFKRREYKEGSTWDNSESYRASVFSNRIVTGSQAFAYYVSDYLFGKSAAVSTVKVRGIDDVRLGDVVRDGSTYMVVVEVNTRREEVTFLGVSSAGRVSWSYLTLDLDGVKDCAVYSRY